MGPHDSALKRTETANPVLVPGSPTSERWRTLMSAWWRQLPTAGRMMAAMLLVVFLVAPGHVNADEFGVNTGTSGRIADNHDHDWCWSDGFTTTDLRNNATNAHINLHNQTLFGGGSLQTCNSGTDVYWVGVYTSAYSGQYQCFDTLSDHRCDRAYARISTNTSVLPLSGRWHTMCHELGHTTGAAHHASGTSYGCMTNFSSSVSYVSHTISHMNNLQYATS